MKRVRSSQEVAALGAGRRRGISGALIGFAVGLVFLVLSPEFHAANCVLMLTVATMGGIMAGRATAATFPPAAGQSGRLGGTLASFGYAMPFVVSYALQAATLNAEGAARLIGALDPAQVAAIRGAGFEMGVTYFQQQFVSYMGAYVIFGALFGQIQGWLGGVIGRRSIPATAPTRLV